MHIVKKSKHSDINEIVGKYCTLSNDEGLPDTSFTDYLGWQNIAHFVQGEEDEIYVLDGNHIIYFDDSFCDCQIFIYDNLLDAINDKNISLF